MADQYEHARTQSAESYESGSGPSSQASTLPGGHVYSHQQAGSRSAYDDYSQDDLVRPVSFRSSRHLFLAARTARCLQAANVIHFL